jgi:two-component system, NarL family, nitrate/nitrite response regulator NarL
MRVLIADDYVDLRDMLASCLEMQGGFEVVQADDLPGALAAMAAGPAFDVVLLDLGMPGMSVETGLPQAVAAAGASAVAILSGAPPAQAAPGVFAAGALGFLPKTLSVRELVSAVRSLAGGERYMPAGIEPRPASAFLRPLPAGLTQRDLGLISALREGLDEPAIAVRLGLREANVRLQLATLCRKLDVADLPAALAWADREGLA